MRPYLRHRPFLRNVIFQNKTISGSIQPQSIDEILNINKQTGRKLQQLIKNKMIRDEIGSHFFFQ